MPLWEELMGGAYVPLWEELMCHYGRSSKDYVTKRCHDFGGRGLYQIILTCKSIKTYVFKMFTKLVIIREAINYCDLAGQTKCTHIAMPPSGQSAHIQVC